MSSRERRPERRDLSTRSGGKAPTADQGLAEVQRLGGLLHEIRNLLDGSLRYVLLARRALGTTSGEAPIDEVTRQLDVATRAMERMSSLAHAAMRGPSLPLGSSLHAPTPTVTLDEAVKHAVEVLRPRAEEHRVAIRASVSPRLADLPAGPLYTLFLNTLRNAVDANVRAGGLGCIDISVVPTPGPNTDDDTLWMAIEVKDEGEGILPQVASRAFEYAYSGTAFGSGIGLAVARSVVDEMNGKIGISTRKDRGVISRPGACVRAVMPVPVERIEMIGSGEALSGGAADADGGVSDGVARPRAKPAAPKAPGAPRRAGDIRGKKPRHKRREGDSGEAGSCDDALGDQGE